MLLLFGESTESVSVNISIVDDVIFEGTEIFQASLTLVDPFIPTVIIVSPSLANISIEDDDSKSTITFGMGCNNPLNDGCIMCYTYTLLNH